jgi:hypothetical protein
MAIFSLPWREGVRGSGDCLRFYPRLNPLPSREGLERGVASPIKGEADWSITSVEGEEKLAKPKVCLFNQSKKDVTNVLDEYTPF